MGAGWAITSSASQVDAVVPYNETSQVVVDGVIHQGEYAAFYDELNTGIRVHWEHDEENLYIGLFSPGIGWVAIGFRPPGQEMVGANIIIGTVDDATGAVTVSDQFAEGRSHGDDSQNDLVEMAGTQSEAETFIEFVFPLNSGDSRDHSFSSGGTYGSILSYHASSDDFGSKHTARIAPLSLQIESTGEPVPELLFTRIHLLILLIGLCLICTTRTYLLKKNSRNLLLNRKQKTRKDKVKQSAFVEAFRI